jgi:hypothetical protein
MATALAPLPRTETRSVFGAAADGVFTRYRGALTFRDKVMGGTPKDPKIIMGWLRSRAGINDQMEAQEVMRRTINELGADVPEGSPFELIEKASEELANRQAVGFKRDDQGLYLESRTLKAALKEAVNVLFAGDRWGATKKGPRSWTAERVFINPDRLHLGVADPTAVELFVGHTSEPKGPQSNLTLYEYVEHPTLTFEVMAAQDDVINQHWPTIWVYAQENGLGALRSQGFGRFDVVEWERQ